MILMGFSAPNEAAQVYNTVRAAADRVRGFTVTPMHPGMTVTPIHPGMTVTPLGGLGVMDPGVKRGLTILGALTFIGFAAMIVGIGSGHKHRRR